VLSLVPHLEYLVLSKRLDFLCLGKKYDSMAERDTGESPGMYVIFHGGQENLAGRRAVRISCKCMVAPQCLSVVIFISLTGSKLRLVRRVGMTTLVSLRI
jgi:hypothetical protein